MLRSARAPHIAGGTADGSAVVGADELVDAMATLVVVVDGAGTVTALRGPVKEWLGLHAGDVIGRPATDFVASEDSELVGRGLVGADGVHCTTSHPAPFRLTLVGPGGLRVVVEALVTNALDDPAIAGWVAVLVPHRALTTVVEPLELWLDGADLDVVLRGALRALTSPNPSAGVEYSISWSERFDDIDLEPARIGRRDAVVAVAGTPEALLEAIRSCARTEIAPVWRTEPPGTLRPLGLDELPLLVSAMARAHGIVGARMATVEVEGRTEVALLSFFDERAWESAHGGWRQRWQRVVRVLEVALTHRRAQHRLELAATHDGLTGLANRSRLLELLHSVHGEVAVVYVDVDDFGAINERYGHFAGDRVLVEVGRRIRRVCRSGDLVGRLGADEFCVVLPATGGDEAVPVGNRLVAAIGQPLPSGIGPERVTVSLGMTRGVAATTGAAELIEVAERAMGFAQRAGGGRMAVAHQPSEVVVATTG